LVAFCPVAFCHGLQTIVIAFSNRLRNLDCRT